MISFLIWVLFFLIAFFSGGNEPSTVKDSKSNRSGGFHQKKAEDQSPKQRISVESLFKNNSLVVLGNYVGLGTFGISSVGMLGTNGYIMGIYVKKALLCNFSWATILKLTLPHFLEYLAIWISGAIGLHGFFLGINLLRGKKLPDARFFILISVAMIICILFIYIAAYLEYYVSMSNLI